MRLQAILCLALASCIPSNVVAVEDRSVRVDLDRLDWQPLAKGDLPGLYESVEVTGEAAAVLWKIFYLFSEGGQYSAAALVLKGESPAFQSLQGTWQMVGKRLDLMDGSDSLEASVSGDHLRFESPTGSVTFRRLDLN